MSAPPIDPTFNVIQLVEAAVERINDLRATDDKWTERVRSLEAELRLAESRRIDAVNLAEARRLDSRLSQQETAVSVASKEAVATAEALRAAATTTAEALRATVAATTATTNAAIKVLEEKQYLSGGRDMQRTEGRQANQWVIALLASLPSTLIAIVVLIKLFAN